MSGDGWRIGKILVNIFEMAVESQNVVVGAEISDFPVATSDSRDDGNDWYVYITFGEKGLEMFCMIIVLKERIIEKVFLAADVLNPFGKFGIAIDATTVIFALEDEETFFRDDE